MTGIVINGNEIYVSQSAPASAVRAYDKITGALLRTITGTTTQITDVDQCAIYKSELYCANYGTNKVLVFPANGDGDIGPTRVITSGSFNLPIGLCID